MKANGIIFVQPEKVVFDSVTLPDPTPQDIVVKTEVSGISVGTERWAYLGKRDEVQFPSVPGYMSVGQSSRPARKRWPRGGKKENVSIISRPASPGSWKARAGWAVMSLMP